MKTDLQINFQQLTDLYDTIVNYRIKVEAYQDHANYFHYVLTEQQSVAFHLLAEDWKKDVLDRIQRLIDRLNQAEQLLLDYITEMQTILTPVDPAKTLRSDRLDIAYNLKQTQQQLLNAVKLVTHYCYVGFRQPADEPVDNLRGTVPGNLWETGMGSLYDEQQRLAEHQKRQRNYQKLQNFQQSFQKAITSYLDNDLYTVYNNTIVPFENTDDYYCKLAEEQYRTYATTDDYGREMEDKIDQIASTAKSAVTGELENLWILFIATSNFTPFLSNVGLLPEKMDQTYHNFYAGVVSMLLNPIQTLESIGQQKMDTYDKEGLSYAITEIGTEVLSEILLAKGLGQLSKLSKVLNVTEDVADYAKVVDELVKGGLDVNLLDELAKSGVKYNPEDIVAITKTADGKIVWLENGNSNAGLEHIMQHADQFAAKGVSSDKIPDFIMYAIKNGKIVGKQRTRPIYEVMYEGKLQRVAISISGNGFIVGANPKSIP